MTLQTDADRNRRVLHLEGGMLTLLLESEENTANFDVFLAGELVAEARLAKGKNDQIFAQAAVPSEIFHDGVMTFSFVNRETQEVAANYSIVAGQPVAADMLVELSVLRAEIELLKRTVFGMKHG